MTPTFREGDMALYVKTGYHVSRGDVVLLKKSGEAKVLIKRVVGMEGDVIDIDDAAHRVIVNGRALDEELVENGGYLGSPTSGRGDVNFPLTVAEGTVFVLGDNRLVSLDSRFTSVGLVAAEELVGKVLVRISLPTLKVTG